jgi:hypothetical protein
MMFGEGKLLIGNSDRGSELERLRTPDQIALFIEQQRALVSQAHREEAEQRVRHLKFDLVQRAVILALAVLIVLALAIGSAGSPLLLRDAASPAVCWPPPPPPSTATGRDELRARVERRRRGRPGTSPARLTLVAA